MLALELCTWTTRSEQLLHLFLLVLSASSLKVFQRDPYSESMLPKEPCSAMPCLALSATLSQPIPCGLGGRCI